MDATYLVSLWQARVAIMFLVHATKPDAKIRQRVAFLQHRGIYVLTNPSGSFHLHNRLFNHNYIMKPYNVSLLFFSRLETVLLSRNGVWRDSEWSLLKGCYINFR